MIKFILSLLLVTCCGKLINLSTVKIVTMLDSLSVSQNLRIPDRLIYCYRGNFTDYWNPQTLPMVIEIIRKIEASRPTSIDLRHLSARLFHE